MIKGLVLRCALPFEFEVRTKKAVKHGFLCIIFELRPNVIMSRFVSAFLFEFYCKPIQHNLLACLFKSDCVPVIYQPFLDPPNGIGCVLFGTKYNIPLPLQLLEFLDKVVILTLIVVKQRYVNLDSL